MDASPLQLLHALRGRPRVPLVMQHETAECGLACLAMLASAHGHHANLTSLRRRFPLSLRGMALNTLMEVAEALGLQPRALRVELEGLEQLALPAILHWDLRHFVVLAGCRRALGGRSYLIHDPSSGRRWLTQAQLSAHFTGVALEAMPGEAFKRQPPQPTLRIHELWSSLQGIKRSLLQILLLSSLLQVGLLAAPFYIQVAIDNVLPTLDTGLLAALAVGFGGLAVMNAASTWLRGFVVTNLGRSLGYQMVANVLRHLLRLPLPWFEKRNIGEIVSRLNSTQPLTEPLSHDLVAAVIDGALAIVTLLLMCAYAPRLALLSLGCFMVLALLRLMLLPRLKLRHAELTEAAAAESGVLIETLRGIAALKAAAREGVRRVYWQNRKADVVNAQIRVGHLEAAMQALQIGCFGIENVLFVYVAIGMAMAGNITVGAIFAVAMYRLSFLNAMAKLLQCFVDFRVLDVHLDRLTDIVRSEPESDREPVQQPAVLSGSLTLRGIRFRYGAGEPEVLRGIDLEVRAGETLAIAGASGGGKTTLLKIMQSLLAPTEGEVLVDGQPLTSYGKAAYRSQIGVVAQDDLLYAGSIAENIAFFDPHIEMERVVACARLALIDAEIRSMPMQYESLVGDMGSALSGGQRQRVLLARALYRQPRILLVDEGTAHLDVTLEARLNQSMRELRMTRVLVAHRPETLRYADRVVTLEQGRLLDTASVPVLTAYSGGGT